MIPKYSEYTEREGFKSKTYALSGNKITGFTDGLQAVEQAVLLILSTERYEHIIYSRNYGVELYGLFGKPLPLAMSEMGRIIREALLTDDRILAVEDFDFKSKRDVLTAEFTVKSKYGDLKMEKAVQINV